MKRLVTIENFLCLIVFSMPLYLVRLHIFGLPTNAFELLTVLAIIILFVKETKYLGEKMTSFPKIVSVGILFILTGLLFSILSNNSWLVGLGIFKGWFLLPILFSLFLYLILDSKTALEKIFLSLYLSAALVGLVSLIYKVTNVVTYDNRLAAFYLSPNYLAMYLVPGIFFGSYFLVKSFLHKGFSGYFFLHAILLALLLLSLYYTYSYGAWAACFVSLLAVTIYATPGKKYWLAGIFVALAAIIFIFQISSPKFLSLAQFSERSSLASRIMIWRASAMLIEQRPLLGIGPGHFQEAYLSLQKYFPPYLEWAVPQPHNLFLAFWLQTGLLGISGFLLLLFFTLSSLLKIIKNRSMTLATPLLGYFLYFVLHGLIDTPYWKNDLAFLFWVCFFSALAVRNFYPAEE